MKLSLGYPSESEEITMLDRVGDGIPFDTVNRVTSPEDFAALREEVRGVHISEEIKSYIVNLVQQTRSNADLLFGASPRASRCLYQGAKALAAIAGRAYVIPEDVQRLFLPVMSHRIELSGQAGYRSVSTTGILEQILSSTPVPPAKENML